jgi:YQGE family putative transporter
MRLFHIGKKNENELKEVYLNLAIRSFAISLINIFVPVYLLVLGFSLQEVLIYIIVIFASAGIFAGPSGEICSRIGLKHTMLISIPLYALYLILLASITPGNQFVYGLAVLNGIAASLYWVPLNSDFAKFSDRKHIGMETGILSLAPAVGSVMGPIIGGLIIAFLGFMPLAIVTTTMLFLSLIPVFTTGDYKSSLSYDWKKLFKENVEFFDSFVAQGILTTLDFAVIPLYIFFLTTDFVSLGGIKSVTMLGAFIFMILIGWLSDKIKKPKMLSLGAILQTIVAALFLFSGNLFYVFFVFFIWTISVTLANIPFFGMVCYKAKKTSKTEFMVMREVGLSVGRIIGFSVFLLMPTFDGFRLIFAFVVLAALYFLFSIRTLK